MQKRITLLALLAIALSISAGCSQRKLTSSPSTRPPAGKSDTITPAAVSSQPSLPPWAPKRPSSAFLRASKLLKPLPAEIINNNKSLSRLASDGGYFVASFELFGTLSDKQVEQFLANREIRLAVKSLSAAQRKMLTDYFAAWKKAMFGVTTGDMNLEDLQVQLYKQGAKENLSNVEVGFIFDGRTVNLQFWIKRAAGNESTFSNTIALR